MQNHKILIVDDEEKILKSLCRLLMNENYEIKTANSAEEGLAILKEFPAQLIISDNMMPGMTGIEFFKKVEDLYPNTIRIILTGRADIKVTIASINEGEIFRFLTKPCKGDELKITIANALKYYDLIKENRSLIQIVRKQRRTVLIVDDDAIIREQLEKELKRNFFNTLLAADGKSALEKFSKNKVDILILDVKLPDMDGLEVLQKVKERNPDCEVIVVTGFGNQEIAVQSLRRGAIDYIDKPLDMEDLFAALGRAQEKLSEKEELSYENTILVIDDEELIVKRLKKYLEKEGYAVFTAFNGKEGLIIIENSKIDVLITDIRMGDMDGIEVIQRAKRLYRDIEGIIITGHKDQELAIRSLRAGASDYITKPINLDELLFSIKKATEKINLNRNRLYRNRELKISSEIISKMNDELERRIKERSQELSQTQAQLIQTSKLATLGEMSAGLAHEMNQPLGGISLTARNFRKLMEREKLTEEELASGLTDIEVSVKRMAKIIQHIRTFSRQDTFAFVKVDLNETIEAALSLLGEQLRLHEIEVVRDFAPDLPRITGEPYQLEQVWINLITNARDAVDEKEKWISSGRLPGNSYRKRITVSTIHNKESENPSVEVRVYDNGIGIAEGQKEKIFEPFFTTKEVGKSMGLGLSISYGIIESHKGRIEAESKEGEGCGFSVLLPMEG
jgi:DNA-binding NtrC family response regulator